MYGVVHATELGVAKKGQGMTALCVMRTSEAHEGCGVAARRRARRGLMWRRRAMLLVIRTDGDDNALSPENARNEIRLHFKRGLIGREVGEWVTP